jgi:hypothetical protein
MSEINVVKHHFSSGVYAKHMEIPDKFEVLTHKHEYSHLSILATGCVIVEVDGESTIHYAPAVIDIDAGKEHKITTVNGKATWFCIHGVSEEYSESEIDEVLIQKVKE